MKRKVNVYSKNTIIKIIKKVSAEYSTGLYTLENVCLNAGVPYRTFKDWLSRYYQDPNNPENKWYYLADVAGLWEASKAEKNNTKKEELIELAESMLMKRMRGYTIENSKTYLKKIKDNDGNEIFKPVRMIISTKNILPSVRLIIFVLERLNPEKWAQRKTFTYNNQPIDQQPVRSLKEIQDEIDELENWQLNNNPNKCK
jgi:hypothetical protein